VQQEADHAAVEVEIGEEHLVWGLAARAMLVFRAMVVQPTPGLEAGS